jgi:hypothetical protein
MRHQPGFIFAQQVQQQRFGIAARALRMRAGAELRVALGEPISQKP